MKSAKTDLTAAQGALTAAQDALTAALREDKDENDLKLSKKDLTVEEILKQAIEHVKALEVTGPELALAKAVVLCSKKKVELERIARGPLPSTAGVSSLLEAFVSWCYNLNKEEQNKQYFILKSFKWHKKDEVFQNLNEIQALEKDLIKDKLDEIILQLGSSKCPPQKEAPKNKTIWGKVTELFSPDYGSKEENTQANKVKALYFLGQFDYSLLRVLKDALVFSIAGGPAIAILKLLVLVANVFYQAAHANFLSIASPENRSRFHLTNILFAGFFILFVLTITGAVPSIIPALPLIPVSNWVVASINILLSNPWIAANYIIVELLGVRKMDMDLPTILNDTFDKANVSRASVNMGVWANIGALISSLLLTYALTGLSLIATVKIAVILVSISTLASSIIFIFWSKNSSFKAEETNIPLLSIINSSSLSFNEIIATIEEKLKKEISGMRAKEEANVSGKRSILGKFGYILKNHTLLCFVGIIAACTAAITTVELVWKVEVGAYSKANSINYTSIMGLVNSITSAGSIVVGLLTGYFDKIPLRTKALTPPLIFAFFTVFFVTSIIAPTFLPSLFMGVPLLGSIQPGMWVIWSGAAVVVTAKWSKYTLFEAANSAAWKSQFGDHFKVAMKEWQQLIKGTTGKFSKASASMFSACFSSSPIIFPVTLAAVVALWYTAASALHPTKTSVASVASKGLDTSETGATTGQSNTINSALSWVNGIMSCL